MSKFVSAVQELGGKKVRFFLGGGDLGYVQGPVKRVDGDLVYIEKEGEIRGTMQIITINASQIRYFEIDTVIRTD